MVSNTPRPLYPRERHGIRCTGGWMGLGAGLDVHGKFRLHQDKRPSVLDSSRNVMAHGDARELK